MQYLKTQYRLLHQYYQQEFKKPFLIITLVFFGIIIVSTIYFMLNKEQTIQAMNWIRTILSSKDVIDAQGNISALGLIRNNLQACLLATGLGVIPFLFLNFFPLIVNTVMVGIVTAGSLLAGQSILFVLAALVPHGIFEIPAILMAITLGYLLCKELVMRILGNRQGVPVLKSLLDLVRMYACIIVPFLIIAGFIEAYITPAVTGFFL